MLSSGMRGAEAAALPAASRPELSARIASRREAGAPETAEISATSPSERAPNRSFPSNSNVVNRITYPHCQPHRRARLTRSFGQSQRGGAAAEISLRKQRANGFSPVDCHLNVIELSQ